MAIRELKTLKVPSETDVIYTLPSISNWHKHFTGNLCSNKDENVKRFRKEIINEAFKYTSRLLGKDTCSINYDRPIVGTGHQSVWFHNGILSKDIAAEAFSRSLGAINLHIILDHDVQNPLIKLPTCHNQKVFTESNIPLEFRRFNPESIDISIYPQNAFCKMWNQGDILTNASGMKNLPDAITYLQGILKAKLGIKPLYLPVSLICQTTVFEFFIRDILKRAGEFVQIYNAAIVNLCKQNPNLSNNIKSLETYDGNRFTLPFWLSSSTGNRSDFRIASDGHRKHLYAGQDYLCKLAPVDTLFQRISERGYYLRPKAITLMLLLRLYLFDWFIHGIGGGKYEPVTDYILKYFYNRCSSTYAIVSLTSTLLEDKDLLSKSNKKVEELIALSRQMRCNPEKFYRQNEPSNNFKELTLKKQAAIKILKERDTSKAQKSLIFKEVAGINSSLLRYVNDKYQEVKSDLEKQMSKKNQLEISDRRDYFFGLFPEERLKNIVNRTLKHECFK